MLTNIAGHNVGTAFIVFDTKEQAENALQLDKTKFKSQILEVELCQGTNFKPFATSRGDHGSITSSPAPSGDGDVAMPDEPGETHQTGQTLTWREIRQRTIAIMNVPDTINDARIRVLAEKYGSVVKLVLRPDHAGATIEFADASAAGRAALGLEGLAIVPNHKLRVGSVKDLLKDKSEQQTADAPKAPKNWITPPPTVRRPVLGGGGKRGGMGFVAMAKKNKEDNTPK
jgi:hypothetical protein